jgi:helicase required for RNAi-mediated heterochromatin assembly 1
LIAKLTCPRSKFDKYIIDGSTKDCPAAYLTEAPGKVAQIPAAAGSFDPSQKVAFDFMTSRELAIIQGPPGTGKTFTSIVALESYVRTLRAGREHEDIPPILVAAQTNHALDQLLDRCSSFQAVIARLGGRTEDETISTRTLYNIRRESKLARNATRGESARKGVLGRIQELLAECFPAHLISAEEFCKEDLLTRDQFDSLNDNEWESAPMVNADGSEYNVEASSIAQWLDGCVESDQTYVYRPPTDQAEALIEEGENLDQSKQENDKERLHGDFFPIKFYLTGSIPGPLARENAWCYQARKLLSKNKNLYNIKPPQRGMVYRLLRMDLISARAGRFPILLKEYQAACDEVKISRWDNDAKIIKDEKIQILGCTTTGLTKYRGLIAALKPRILMIEEAAETREGNLTSALYPSLDQIVLVGDHQQLVPQVDVRELGGSPFNMNVSLFERLVKLGLPYRMLEVQRRMVPAIREVVNTFYKELKDHPSVTNPDERPPVPGMGGKNLWWFHHEWEEMQNANDFSFSNVEEAGMIVRFVRYLVQNGVLPKEITMLTFYKGQVTLLLEKLRRDPVLAIKNPTKEWSVRTVDGFQGEENEIIILSIVRSDRPGFVSNENRAVVATSRAKCGMYIFGNALNLLERKQSHETWAKVYDVFQTNECIDFFIPVTCKNHGRVTEISEIEDWDIIPGAGCDQSCDQRCSEGHPCQTTCHPFVQSDLKCQKACEKALDCGHNCGAICGDPCECSELCRKTPTLTIPLRGPPLPGPSQHQQLQTTKGGRAGRNCWRKKRGGEVDVQRGHSHTAVAGQSIQPLHQQEPTSDDIIERGYHSQIVPNNQFTSMTMGRFDTERSTIQTTTHFESAALPSTEGSVSAEESCERKWSPEKLLQNDKVIRDKLKGLGKRKTPCPPVINAAFRQTTATTDGSRTYGPIVYDAYTHQPTIPSRKQSLLDAAAGECSDIEYRYFLLEERLEETRYESDVGGPGDLISFE